MQLLWEGLSESIRLLMQGDTLVLQAAWRSLWVSLVAVGIAAIFGIAIGSLLAGTKFRGRSVLVILFRVGMAVPTVLIGVVGFAMLSRSGPLGGLDLLYTPWGIALCEIFLALPIIVTLTHGSIRSLDARVAETAWTLGAGPLRRWQTSISEARLGITLALLAAFARCFTELGIAMLVGGNIKSQTRTLATATALETSKGEFARGIAMSLILLFMALVITTVAAWLSREQDRP
ncbi:MAG: ABC transporter permease [Pirellulales bacterium]|nr:ABC transporter permease [Pirellulales bacterium]